jgi:hypothetical protein
MTSQLDLENNNRGRIIALAHIFEDRLGSHAPQVACIADRDFDTILEKEYHCKQLLFTDYTCIEMYAFNEATLEKLLEILSGKRPKSTIVLLQKFASALQELFLIRLASLLLKWNLTHVTWHKCCSIDEQDIQLDSGEYIKRYLNANARSGEIRTFHDAIGEFRKKLLTDARHQINGHDFVTLLWLYLNKISGKHNLNGEATLAQILLLSIDLNELSKETLFVKLLAT